MMYPPLEEVEKASKYQLGCWYRFLPSPQNDAGVQVMNRIVERFNELGGWTPELSKQIGWMR